MIALLLVSQAWGGLLDWGCTNGHPIAGTAGFHNGLTAVRKNATTYAAGSFARRELRGPKAVVWDMRMIANAATVPSQCRDQNGRIKQTVYGEPLDLAATNIGFNIPLVDEDAAKFRVFYASSVTQSMMWPRTVTIFAPMMGIYPALLAPMVLDNNQGSGLGTFAVDFIAGATFRSDVISVQTGLAGADGLYLDVTQDVSGLFANTIFRNGFDLANTPYLLGGVQNLDPTRLGVPAGVGMPSFYYSRLPTADALTTTALAEAATQEILHGSYADIAEMVDVHFEHQLDVAPRELSIAGHNAEWHPRHEDDGELASGYYVRAGAINLPERRLLGVDGGVLPTVLIEGKGYEDNMGGALGAVLSARLNDPDLLLIHPYARNSVSLRLSLEFILK